METNWNPIPFLEHLQKTILMKFTESSEVMEQNIKAECPVITGKLVNSIDRNMDVNGETMTARITAKAPYAWFVEMGTVKMAARAFMRRGLANSIPAIQNIFRRNEKF